MIKPWGAQRKRCILKACVSVTLSFKDTVTQLTIYITSSLVWQDSGWSSVEHLKWPEQRSLEMLRQVLRDWMSSYRGLLECTILSLKLQVNVYSVLFFFMQFLTLHWQPYWVPHRTALQSSLSHIIASLRQKCHHPKAERLKGHCRMKVADNK